MKITITQDHIDEANRRRHDKDYAFSITCDCPTAIAVKDLYPDKIVEVGYTILSIGGRMNDPGALFSSFGYDHPLQQQIARFTQFTTDGGFEPGEYDVPDPVPYVKNKGRSAK